MNALGFIPNVRNGRALWEALIGLCCFAIMVGLAVGVEGANSAAATEPHGSVFTVLLPPGSQVLLNQEFIFKAQFHYYDTPGNWQAKIEVSSPDEPMNETMKEAAYSTFFTPSAPRDPAPTRGMIEHEFKVAFKQKTGRLRIVLKASLLNERYAFQGEIGTYEFGLDCFVKPRLVIKSLTPSPGGQDHILINEEVPVRVEVEYHDLIPQAAIFLTLSGTELINSRYTEATQVGQWQSRALEGGNGTITSPNIIIKPTREDDLGYEWRVSVTAETMWADPVYKSLSFGVSKPTPLNVEIDKLDYVKSPETISIGESTPVTIHAKYRYLPNPTILTAVVYDRDKAERIDQVDSVSLSGTGEYEFKHIVIKPDKAGEWKLQARIKQGNQLVVSDNFKIVVDEAVQPTATLAITEVAGPSDEVQLRETFPITLKVRYRNLQTGTKLKARVRDTDKSQTLAELESEYLQGSGTYTFRPFQCALGPGPINRDVEVKVIISGMNSISAKETLTIKLAH